MHTFYAADAASAAPVHLLIARGSLPYPELSPRPSTLTSGRLTAPQDHPSFPGGDQRTMPTTSQHDRPPKHQPLAREETYTYPTRNESVRHARAQLFKTLDAWGFGQIADDLILCLSEAFTNALLYGTPGREITVHVKATGTTVRIEVDDCDDEAEPQIQVPPEATGQSPPALADVAAGGRGVLLITMLSDDWGVRRLATGKAVWFERDASGAARA